MVLAKVKKRESARGGGGAREEGMRETEEGDEGMESE
jgi:hypothetical protein